jgi:Xaa-Pro aminopeptidase
MLDPTARSLMEAQIKAERLFREVIESGMVQPGKRESELTSEIHALARTRFGLRRHWHKRIVRAGSNTVSTYHDAPPDRRIEEDDVVYFDFGPVFEAWEADFGRTYVLGSDPRKRQLVLDIATAFERGKELYRRTRDLTAGALYDFVAGLAAPAGWRFGAPTAGHLIGRFPHERLPEDPRRLTIRHANETPLRALSIDGQPRHWILEIHFVDPGRRFGGFFEELLTVDVDMRAW